MKKSVLLFGTVGSIIVVMLMGSYFYLGERRSCILSLVCTKSGTASRSTQQATSHLQPLPTLTALTEAKNDLKTNKIKKDLQKIQWISFNEVQKKIQQNPKKIFVDLYTDWCGWCKVLDKRTYTDPQVIDYLNKHYYSVKFNAEQRGSVNFSGQEYKFVSTGRSGYHELAAALTEGNLSYPTLVFIDSKLAPITYIPGFQTAEELLDILVFLKEDLHQSMNFKDFKEKRKTEKAATGK